MAGYKYECVVTSDYGSVTSSPATITIAPFYMYVVSSVRLKFGHSTASYFKTWTCASHRVLTI
jgi:hypothetical protein